MASKIVRRGKLYVDIFYPERIQKSFEIHRDLKSCISLREGMQVFKQNEEYISKYEKTAFLQFLNNYPMSYNYRTLEGPMRLNFEILKLENLSMYEEQIKFSVLTRLREYMPKYLKQEIVKLIEEQQAVLLKRIKHQPFDLVHATNFLFLHKDSSDHELYEHCIWALKNSEYSILLLLFPKVAPMVIKRIGVNDWNILRQFKHLLDFMVYDWVPKMLNLQAEISILMNMVDLQLHLVGYQRIPVFIDEVFEHICKDLENQSSLDILSLQLVFSAFKFLPVTYNPKAFHTIRLYLLQRLRLKKQSFHGDKLPYHRLSPTQVMEFYEAGLNKHNILESLLYVGNDPTVRKWIKNSKFLQILYHSFCRNHEASIKNLSVLTVSASILSQALGKDEGRCEAVKKVWVQVIREVMAKNKVSKVAMVLPLSGIFHLIQLDTKFKTGLDIDALFNEFASRTNEYKYVTYLKNILHAVQLYYNSQNPRIVACINSVLLNIIHANTKFHFKYYTEYALLLERSASHQHYQKVIDLLYEKLDKDDSPYFVELYNRFPNKNIRLNNSVIQRIWNKQKSFKSIGKFLLSSNYSLFTSPKGYLLHELKDILNQIEPFLSVSDLNGYKLAEVTHLINFCHNFYPSIKGFCHKLLLASMKYAEGADLTQEGIKLGVNFLQAAAMMGAEYELHEQFADKVMKFLATLKETFPQQLLLNVKQVELRWLYKLPIDGPKTQLLIDQTIENLSSLNYQSKYFDLMLLLLKMHAFKAIELAQQTIDKLEAIILEAIEAKEVRLTLLANNAALITKKNVADIDSDRAVPLVKIMSRCLEESEANHTFEYLWNFVELGYRARNEELLTSAVNAMANLQLLPYQITKLFDIIRFFPYMCLSSFISKVVPQIQAFARALDPFLAELIYIIHSLQKDIPQDQLQMYSQIMNRSQFYLVKTIKERNSSQKKIKSKRESDEARFLLNVLKSLWVSVKSNYYTKDSLQLFKFVLGNEANVQALIRNKGLEGLTWEHLYYIYPVFKLKFTKELAEPTLPGKNKPFKKSKPTAFNNVLFKNQPNLDFSSQQQKSAIKSQLAAFNLVPSPSKKPTALDNCFIEDHQVNGITLPFWIRKEGKQYGLLILDERYFNRNQEEKGRVEFMRNALGLLTNLHIRAVTHDQKIRLE